MTKEYPADRCSSAMACLTGTRSSFKEMFWAKAADEISSHKAARQMADILLLIVLIDKCG